MRSSETYVLLWNKAKDWSPYFKFSLLKYPFLLTRSEQNTAGYLRVYPIEETLLVLYRTERNLDRSRSWLRLIVIEMDAELLELQRQFEFAQQAKSSIRLSDRNVVELVHKLQELHIIDFDLLHTVSGKEYITPVFFFISSFFLSLFFLLDFSRSRAADSSSNASV